MSPLKKALVGCAALLGLGLVAAVALVLFVTAKESKYDRIALPFFEEVMPVLSTWDPEALEGYWAPEIRDQTEPEKLRRLFQMFQALGPLVSFDEPEFQNVGVTTEVPYPSVVLYVIEAEYEAGRATLTFRLVPKGADCTSSEYSGHSGSISKRRFMVST